jgi:malate-CoA ligase subunit alpha
MAILITEDHPRPRAGHVRPHRPVPHRGNDRSGTNVVAGVTPGKGGTTVLNRRSSTPCARRWRPPAPTPRSSSCRRPFAADAMMEAADAGIRTAVCVTDGIPAQDMMKVKRFLRRYPRENRRCA